MPVRGIRGATTTTRDDPDLILAATRELLEAVVAANGIAPDDIASAIFTVTPDLTSEFPARAARGIGWEHVPLLGATEMAVPHGPPRCIRVLIHVNTARAPHALKHIYLRDAHGLRPDR